MASLLGSPAEAAIKPTTQPAEPVQALLAVLEAARSGDADRVQHLLYPEQPEDAGMLDAFAAVAVAEQRLNTAAVKQFGDRAAAAAGLSPSPLQASLLHATVVVHDADAVVTPHSPDSPAAAPSPAAPAPAVTSLVPVHLHRINAAWRVSPAFVVDRIENAMTYELGGRYYKMAASLDEVRADLTAGQFPTAAATAQAAATAKSRAAAGTDAQ